MGRLRRPFKIAPVITQPWGPTDNTFEPAAFGFEHFHLGVDYAMPTGTCIIAPAAGRVIAASWDTSGFGNACKIDVGGGLVVWLCHLSAFRCRVGDEVNAGELVALSGDTGNSTGPHLHFGTMLNGEWRPPAVYIFGNG